MGFEDCWERVRQATDLKKQTQLAKFLDINPTSISGAKFRDTFPTDWAFKIGQNYKINSDWILTGEGAMKAEPRMEDGANQQYGRDEKEVEPGGAGMGESEDVIKEEERAHKDLDAILQFGNTYQRGAVKGYLSELSTEITDKIKRVRDHKSA